jgi:pyruvate dehydrogenase E2 component (dihydrolipoamide acetyltransferase)
MATATQVKVPDIGDFADVPIIEVHVSSGDAVNEDDPVVTLESDKATMDIPAPAAGSVAEVLVKVGDLVSEGTPILVLEPGDGALTPPPSLAEQQEPAPEQTAGTVATAAAPPPAPAAAPPTAPAAAAGRAAEPHAGPSVRRLAHELGIDLAAVRGSGEKGRILKEDLLAVVRGPSQAAVSALKQFPEVNSSLAPDRNSLVLKRYYHLGVAVDTADGLVVPVLRDVDRKGITELSRELGEVSAKARAGKLSPTDMQGGTFTISSLGGIGGTDFTPIVNAPEVAILGVVRSRMAPVWDGEAFVPRLLLPLSLSYDHRVIDGALAARFVRHLGGVLEDVRRLVL